MSDEDVGGTTIADSGSGTSGTTSSSDEGGVGDFFETHAYDDGGSGVVESETGTSLLDKDGNKFKGPDAMQRAHEYWQSRHGNAGKPADQPQTATRNNQTAAPAAKRAISFDNFISPDGKINNEALSGTTELFNAYKHEFSTEKFIKAQQQGQQTQQKEPVPSDPVEALNKRIENYHNEQKNLRVQPIIDHWYEICKSYGGEAGVPEEVSVQMNALYNKALKSVNEFTQKEDRRQRDEYLREISNRKNPQDVEAAYTKSFLTVAGKYFKNDDPNKSVKNLEALILGKVDPKTKQLVQPGYGTDIVDLLFHSALTASNRSFSSGEEWAQEYKSFWHNIASNPDILSLIARTAWDRFYSSNGKAIRDLYRETWEKEKRGISSAMTRKPNSAANAAPDIQPNAIDRWMNVPGTHMK